MKKKSQKVFKHVLTNPFSQAWPDISNEETLQLVNILQREAVAQAISGIKLDNKIQKTNSASLDSFTNANLIIGINKVIKNIEQVSAVVLLKCDANEVLLEPLVLLSRNKGIKCICGNFEVVYEKMGEITGVKKLAAFALPKINPFPQTESFINSIGPRYPPKSLLPVKIFSKEIIRQPAK